MPFSVSCKISIAFLSVFFFFELTILYWEFEASIPEDPEVPEVPEVPEDPGVPENPEDLEHAFGSNLCQIYLAELFIYYPRQLWRMELRNLVDKTGLFIL